jgi:phage N-6-adenine-methyltransferase
VSSAASLPKNRVSNPVVGTSGTGDLDGHGGVALGTRFYATSNRRSDNWETPAWLFAVLDREFHFDLDAAALPDTAKCAEYFTPVTNGLSKRWAPRVVWCNPPYARDVIPLWMAKCRLEAFEGATVVCLVPSSTSSAWWQDHVMRASEIRLIRGRLNFSNAKPHRRNTNAAHSSAIVVFRPGHVGPPKLGTLERARVGSAGGQ